MNLNRPHLPELPHVSLLVALAVCAVFCLALAVCASEPPVVPAERWVIAETATNTTWMDRMTDGSERQSVIPKMPEPRYVCLVATQDVGFAYRYLYRVRRSDGSVITNSSFRAKPKKQQLDERIAGFDALREGPPFPTNTELMAAAAETVRPPAVLSLARAVTEHRKRLARTYNLSETLLPDGRVEFVRSDGSVVTAGVERVVSARRDPPAAHLLAVEVEALGRALGADPKDKRACAKAIEKLRKDLEKGKEKGNLRAVGDGAGPAAERLARPAVGGSAVEVCGAIVGVITLVILAFTNTR